MELLARSTAANSINHRIRISLAVILGCPVPDRHRFVHGRHYVLYCNDHCLRSIPVNVVAGTLDNPVV